MGSVGDLAELPVIWHDDDPSTYDEARVGRVFNQRRPKRYPVGVVQASSEKHIIDAVKLAKQRGCRVSVRSGGHSWAAWSVREGAILIDLGKYHSLEFDEAEMVVRASPSTTGRVLNGMLLSKGYMFPGGHCPDVGIGGFLLQGGMGWNCRNWGWACEYVVGVDVVTANGEHLHCNANQNQELFWMARGAGPGFPAIVTKFHLRVRKAAPVMLQSFWCWPKSRTKEIINWVATISPDYDAKTEIVAVSQTLPGHSEHTICSLFVTFAASVEAGHQALEQANKTRPEGCIIEELNQPTNLPDQYVNQAAANPLGHRYCADNAYVSDDADIGSVLEHSFTTLPHPKAFALYYAMGGACTRRQLPDMALSMQTDHYFALYTVWEDEVDDERCQGWVRQTMKGVERESQGAYLGDSDFQIRRTRFWADDNAKRLMELRQKWDPEGRICGYLDIDDASGVNGLANVHEWKELINS